MFCFSVGKICSRKIPLQLVNRVPREFYCFGTKYLYFEETFGFHAPSFPIGHASVSW